jgi:chromate reductase, NAD(P)H dehydrogenase (quinone)
MKLLDDLKWTDTLLLACPEYNYSIVKNALDWASREPENHLLDGKTAAILGSGGGMGSERVQYQIRQVCVFLNLHLLNKPEVFSNAFNGSFDSKVTLTDGKIQLLVIEQLKALQHWARIVLV